MRLHKILCDAFTIEVHHPQIMLCIRMPLLRRLAIPLCRFDIILWNAMAFGVHQSQVILRPNVSLFRRPTAGLYCLSIVLLPAWAEIVYNSQIDLCSSESLICQRLELFAGFGIATSVTGRFTVIETGMSKGGESDR